MADERLYTVETPEQIELLYDVAGIGSRFLAALIDHVLIGLILGVLFVLVAVVADQVDLGMDPFLVAGLFSIAIYLFLCAYYIFFETIWNGQTPGKRLVGVRTVRTGGRPVGFLGSTIRNVIRFADFLPVLYGIGVIVMFLDSRSRRLGDLAAGTLAVKERRLVTLEMLGRPVAEEPVVVVPARELTIPNLAALNAPDWDIVVAYLRRRDSLAPEVRGRLARLLVDGLEARLGYQIQGDGDTFLTRLVAEHQLLSRRAEVPVAERP